MAYYVARRLVMLVPTVWATLTLVFVVVRLLPGDVAGAILGANATEESLVTLRSQLGLDAPLPVQYLTFLADVARADFGRSLFTNRPVAEEIARNLPHTLQLALAATVLSVLIGVPVGIYSAVRRATLSDHVLMIVALIGVAAPEFWLGILALLLFSVTLGWTPILGAAQAGAADSVRLLILPAAVLGFALSGLVTRMTRSSMLEVLAMDYVRTARAKGLREWLILVRHALPNALIPIVTTIGHNIGRMVAGTAVLELVFVRPGLGSLLVNAVLGRDYPIIQAVIIYYGFMVVIGNLIVDLSYRWLDPRVRYE